MIVLQLSSPQQHCLIDSQSKSTGQVNTFSQGELSLGHSTGVNVKVGEVVDGSDGVEDKLFTGCQLLLVCQHIHTLLIN